MSVREKPIVLIASLRDNIRYLGPLGQMEDNIWYCLDRYMKNEGKDKYQFKFFKTSFDGSHPQKDPRMSSGVDKVIVVSSVEWTYHIPGYYAEHTRKKSHEEIQELNKNLEDTDFILITNEHYDTLSLFKDITFEKNRFNSMTRIGVEDIGNEFMELRHKFILDSRDGNLSDVSKDIDFVFWGRSRSKIAGGVVNTGDNRSVALHDICYKTHTHNTSKIQTSFTGKFDFDRNEKNHPWTINFKKIMPTIERGVATLCFQKPGLEHRANFRYGEALACGIIPLVWKDFDKDGKLYQHDKWQEVDSVYSLFDKLESLREPNWHKVKFEIAWRSYHSRPGKLNREQVYQKFIQVLEDRLEGTATSQ